jgi:hypothetical protein
MRHRSHQLYIGTYIHLDSAPGHAVAARFGQEFVKKNGAPDRVFLRGSETGDGREVGLGPILVGIRQREARPVSRLGRDCREVTADERGAIFSARSWCRCPGSGSIQRREGASSHQRARTSMEGAYVLGADRFLASSQRALSQIRCSPGPYQCGNSRRWLLWICLRHWLITCACSA